MKRRKEDISEELVSEQDDLQTGVISEETTIPSDQIVWLPEPAGMYKLIKRLIDLCFSSVALVLMAPLFAILALLIKVTSRGPVFFKQERLGLRGKPFTCLKFRTMLSNTDLSVHREFVRRITSGTPDQTGPVVYKMTADPRITRIGRFLRRTSLDELPQFINVFRGEMSLVGPRPPVPYEYECYDDWHKLRLSCKPGITGLWQVSGGSHTSFDGMVELDLEYIKHQSLAQDLKILLKTPFVIFSSAY